MSKFEYVVLTLERERRSLAQKIERLREEREKALSAWKNEEEGLTAMLLSVSASLAHLREEE